MHNQNIIQQISMAIASALLLDLPDVAYRNWTPGMKRLQVPPDEAPLKRRRPREEEVEVITFPQTWGSTALGFGGMGGASITTAQTTVVSMPSASAAAVYFGCGLGYVVHNASARFWEDLSKHSMASRREAADYGDIASVASNEAVEDQAR